MKHLFSMPRGISVPPVVCKVYCAVALLAILSVYLLADTTLVLVELAFFLTVFILMDALFDIRKNPPTAFRSKLLAYFACSAASVASVILLFLFLRLLIYGTIG